VTVDENQRSVGVVAVLQDSGARLYVNGTRTASGALRSIRTVAIGTNRVAVQVIARDKVSVQTYWLNIIRTACKLNMNMNMQTFT